MRSRLLPLGLLALAALAACATRPPAPPAVPAEVRHRITHPTGTGGTNALVQRARDYLVMVSFDGFRADYLDRYPAPHFARVARAGVRADGLVPVFPTLTFPNHYSIATGMYAERHGIVGNHFYDPVMDATYRLGDRAAVEDGRFYGGEPIWLTAETQGMVAASFYWVGSEAPVQGVRPTHWKRYDQDTPYEDRVDTTLAWLALPEAHRPHLVTLYFSAVDSEGHRHGPDADQTRAAVARVDEALGRLLDGIEALPHGDRVNVVLVSDHGMAAPNDAQRTVVDELVDLGPDVRSFSAGPHLGLNVGSEARADSIDRLLDARLEGTGVVSYRPREMPEAFHYRDNPRIPQLVVLAERPGVVGLRAHFERPWTGGAHGYTPADPQMHGIFLAMGPGVQPVGRVPAFENVHVYPFAAALLGLVPNPAADGRADVLAPLLRPRD